LAIVYGMRKQKKTLRLQRKWKSTKINQHRLISWTRGIKYIPECKVPLPVSGSGAVEMVGLPYIIFGKLRWPLFLQPAIDYGRKVSLFSEVIAYENGKHSKQDVKFTRILQRPIWAKWLIPQKKGEVFKKS